MAKPPLVDKLLALVRPTRTARRPVENREERFRSAIERLPIGIGIATPDGRWLQVNEAFRSISGYSSEELARITLASITHPDDAKREAPLVRRLIDGEDDSYRIEKRVMDKRGNYQVLDVTVAVARGVRGLADSFVHVLLRAGRRHIDLSHASEQAAIGAIDQLVDVAVIRSDEKGVITSWNEGARRMFGYSADEVIGKHRRLLQRSTSVPGDHQQWRVARDGAAVRVRSWTQEYTIDEKKGLVEILTPPAPEPAPDVRQSVEQLRRELEKERKKSAALDQALADRKKTSDAEQELRRELEKERAVGGSLRQAIDDLRTSGEASTRELKVMTAALRREIDRRKALEDELRGAREQLAAVPSAALSSAGADGPAEREHEISTQPESREWMPLGEGQMEGVLRDIADGGKSGTLIVERDRLVREFFFESGRLFSSSSNDPADFLAQRLIARGTLTEEERQRALEIRQHTQLALGRILIILGAIEEEQLVDTLRDKLREEVIDIVSWSEGRWSFVDGTVASLQIVPLRVDVREVLDSRFTRPVAIAAATAKKYHRPSCKSAKKIAARTRREFASEAEAEARGLQRCRICF